MTPKMIRLQRLGPSGGRISADGIRAKSYFRLRCIGNHLWIGTLNDSLFPAMGVVE